MDEAAPQAAVTGTDEDALAALRFNWGEAYRIGWDPVRGWWAHRRDDLGGDITRDNPDDLWKAVRDDYDLKPVPRDYSAPTGGNTAAPFTTAGLGIIPGTNGDVDDVVRRNAWLEAHPGGTAGQDDPGDLVYTARWPDGSLAASGYGALGAVMSELDKAEAEGRCPVHGASS